MTSTDVFPKGPFSMYLLIYLVRHLKTLESCHKRATPLIFPAGFTKVQKYFLARLSPLTNFTVVCLTVHKGSGFTDVPWAINSETKPNYKRWSGLDSDNSCTPLPVLQHLRGTGTACLAHLPICSQLISVKATWASLCSSSALLTLWF